MRLFFHKKNPSAMGDAELVSAVISGDKDAIVYMLYTKFSATFQYHIYKLFDYKIEVADLIDEFFLYLYEDEWKRLKVYDSAKSSLSTWISTVSYRFFRDYKKSKIDLNGLITISNKWETYRTDWVEEYDKSILVDIESAIQKLKSDRDRKIAEMIFIKDCELEIVAADFQISIDYVYTIKNRVSKQLKVSLEGY